MSCLNINLPSNENVNINFNSNQSFISGQSGAITGNQNYSIGLAPYQVINTNRINISSGAAPYDAQIILNSGNSFDGGLMKFVLNFPNSSNPSISFVDQSTNNLLLIASGLMTGFATYLEFSNLNNEWLLNQWA